MTAHTLVHEERRRRVFKRQLFQLGWPYFWLLSAILAGILGLVALVFLAGLTTR
jgi:hypothetical protein